MLGALLGWWATFWAVAALCLPAAIGVLAGIPTRRVRKDGPALRPEPAQLKNRRLLLVMLLGALVNAATFAGSYATAALNIGAAIGPLIAATTLNTTTGNLGPLWASAILIAVALLTAFRLPTMIAADRSTEVLQRGVRRPVVDPHQAAGAETGEEPPCP
jgi:DHA1 family chloramphenicol resistance protein-like MFS transporter